MALEQKHINLFEKLHKLYISESDKEYFQNKYEESEEIATELSNSAAALRLLSEFVTKLDCQGIGFDKLSEFQKTFNLWLETKSWKGVGHITNYRALIRKQKEFEKLSLNGSSDHLDFLIHKNKGNQSSLKFNDKHIKIFQNSFQIQDFDLTYQNYLRNCSENELEPVSKATVYNYFKKFEDELTEKIKASNLDNLHSQFISLSDFDIFHSKFNNDEKISAELVNSAACLMMLNYPNLKSEIKHLGFNTKESFLKETLLWLKTKDWYGLKNINNPATLRHKAANLKNALKQGREEGLFVLCNKQIGNKNAFLFNKQHQQIVLALVKTNNYPSKISCYKDYVIKCKEQHLKPLGEGTVSQFLIEQKLFENHQYSARTYSKPEPIKLTEEQIAILNCDRNLKINAVAGSGKTTTLLEFAKSRNKNSKILYLAFNRSVKNEAQKKFRANGIKNVDITTAHSLAYRHIVGKEDKHLLSTEISPIEILNSLEIDYDSENKSDKIILASHINRFFTFYCNNTTNQFSELNYLDIVFDEEARSFALQHLKLINKYAELLCQKMDTGEMRFTHDFYLKKFQLSNPKLDYDYIFFDEGQDASPAMLDVFLKQNSKKIIVGDSNQQIYGWRYAINSLERVDFEDYNLTQSFRFNNGIAHLAVKIIEQKRNIGTYKPINIIGLGNTKQIQTKATLARTNLKLLEMAIDDVYEKKKVKSIYFEGHISTYKFGERNSIISDVLSLYSKKNERIKNPLIKEFSNFKDLIYYSKKTEDNELNMLINLVIRYKGKLPALINGLKEIHLTNSQKNNADMIYSTVHKCKGMEYDEVIIADDFMTEKSIVDFYKENNERYNRNKLNEEINLLYVAVTRAKNKVHIPDELIPKDKSIGIRKNNAKTKSS
ncbi:UvrD-like helicase C-terminal domain-containing protein [Mariniphaga anaerophila]|uniref:UvrD-like helicase C-terminal domain-containing protein n=1 Tax=Mariniphaga anaerophila TaxID=1484053 RepID=A0A1M5GPH4_9BACT|nr:UvrD-helicase domain-containing protein [Mariniphaga anaerophila]SHG05422.1 UvrD-like helicase C-terminal domain-containing protein [Mariniphaga anaerophila]